MTKNNDSPANQILADTSQKKRSRDSSGSESEKSDNSKKTKTEGSSSGDESKDSFNIPGVSPAKSTDSNPTYSNTRVVDLLLVSAKYSSDEVTFEIEKGARPDAEVTGATGTTQGDHVTAYVSFLEFLYNITNDKELKQISSNLIDVAKSILVGDKQKEVFDELKKKFDTEVEKYYSRDERKGLTAKLRSEKQLPLDQEDQQLSRLKSSLKLAENTIVGQFVQELGRGFIREINLAENIAFAKQGKADSQEGNRVKQATYTLRLINELQKVEEFKKLAQSNFGTDALQKRVFNTENQLIQKLGEPNSELKQGLKRILETDPEIVKQKAEIEDKKNKLKTKLKTKIESEVDKGKKLKSATVDQELEKRISDRVKREFDKILDKRISELTDISSGEAKLFRLLSDRQSDLPKIIGDKFGDLFDFKFSLGKDGMLPFVAARHLVILFHAFPNLQRFDVVTRGKIIDNFIEDNVLEVQGWKASKTELGIPITKNQINSDINGKADLSSDKFRMRTESEIEALKQSQGRSI